ncbi:MAG: AI-2E family transporter [Gudongella sp.]|jgi:sporulation integral membrane protein YtvI|nr:AI-2E family transporter [Gudongella sp.]
MQIQAAPELFVKLVWILTAILLFLTIYYLINIGNRFVPSRKAIKYKTKFILWVIAGLFTVYFVSRIFARYHLVSDTFFTVIASMILAYLLNPPVNWFEKKGLKRVWATAVVYLIILGGIIILFLAVLPRTGRELKRLGVNLPDYINSVRTWFQSFYSEYASTLDDMPELVQSIEKVASQNVDKLQELLVKGTEAFVMGISNMLTRIISIVLMPILTFYLLVDKDHFLKKAASFIPKKQSDEIHTLLREMDQAMSQFIRGRLLMAVAVGVATTVFLFIMKVEFSIIIGFITGLADIIPYIGPFLGFVPAVVFAFIASPMKAVWVALFFVLIQWVENNILGPKVLGKTTGLHPLTILLSIIIGGAMFGVMGMILSVPAVNIAIILYKYFKGKLAARLAENSDNGTN